MASQLLSASNTWPPPSALTSFIASAQRSTSATEARSEPPPQVSASTEDDAHLQYLALQVQHQLQHQYDWRDVQLHTHKGTLDAALTTSELATVDPPTKAERSGSVLSRCLLTGVPPRHLYTHPDVQVALIKAGKTEDDLPIEPVVVVAAHVREGGWTLERLSGVFDGLEDRGRDRGEVLERVLGDVKVNGKGARELDTMKRVLLAVVEDDSTVVFYWVHDGLVKPRQN